MTDTSTIQDPSVLFDALVDYLIRYIEYLQDEGVTGIELSPEKSKLFKMTPAPGEEKPPSISVGRETYAPGTTADDAVKAELAAIAEKVASCVNCSLHQQRTKTVPGQGSCHPDILFVGEGPGEDEDIQGLAFVGRAGQLLTRLITRMGYRREEVFIANVVKCRPPGNRKPMPDEMEACLPYLKAQIAILKPKVLVALGATALEGLIHAPEKIAITRMRGQWLSYEGIPVMPTFHPSYLLRNESAMWDVWKDMQEVLRHLGRTPPPRRS